MNTVTQVMFLLLYVSGPESVGIHSAWVTSADCERGVKVVRKAEPRKEFYCSRSTIKLHEVRPPRNARAYA